MLKAQQLAPNFRLSTIDGKIVQLWDFRQRKNVVLVFAPDRAGELTHDILNSFKENLAEYRSANTVILFVISDFQQSELHVPGTDDFHILLDKEKQAARSYFGQENHEAGYGVFIIDRYGELWTQWQTLQSSELPSQKEIIDSINLIEMQCPECGISDWR